MNKKNLTLGLAIILFATVFMGCKKGENDPMSLATRKARLTGEWVLSEASYVNSNSYDGVTATSNYSYDGANMTSTYNGDGTTYAYTEKITIEKDGTFKSVTTKVGTYYGSSYEEKTGTSTTTTEGVWYFIDGNKELDVKDKERVEFMITKKTEINYNGDTEVVTYTGKSNSMTNTILLDRLASKEMITLFDSSKTSNYSDSQSGTKTYIQE